MTLKMAHFQKWFMNILEDIYEFDTHAVGLPGISRCGNSPAGPNILLPQCRNNTAKLDCDHEPCLRVTTEFDLLRGEHGHMVMADFLDDGGIFMIVPKAMLSFTDLGLFEAMAWARWGCTECVQQQPSGCSDNAFYPIEIKSSGPSLAHSQLVQVIKPSVHFQATTTHIDALLKRTACLVVAEPWVA